MSERSLSGRAGVLSEASLAKIYGGDRAKAILAWIDEFVPFEGNFPRITAGVHEISGRPLLLLSCPTLFRREDGEHTVNIGVGFTQQFPERPPHCAVLLGKGQRLRPDHPIVAPNGSIRLAQLPGLATEPRPGLCTILVAAMDAFEKEFPLLPPSATPPSPSQQQQPQQPSGVPQASGAAAGDQIALTRAQELILDALGRKGEEYVATREAALKHQQYLAESKATLDKLEDSLAEKKRQLLLLQPEVVNLHELIDAWKQSGEFRDTGRCLIPADAVHAQAIELLADVQTADDVLELLDRALGKEIVSCDAYLKRVSAVARRQFMAKYLLKKATGQIAASANVASLARRFPMFDEETVKEVLQSTGFDVGHAAAQLAQMAEGQ